MRPDNFTTVEELRRFISQKELYYVDDYFHVQKIDTTVVDVIITVFPTRIAFSMFDKQNKLIKDTGLLDELFVDKTEAERKAAELSLEELKKAVEEKTDYLKNYNSAIKVRETQATEGFNYFSQKSLKWWFRFKSTPELSLLLRVLRNKLGQPLIDSEDRLIIIMELYQAIFNTCKARNKDTIMVSEAQIVAFCHWWVIYKATHGINFKGPGRPPKKTEEIKQPTKPPVNVDNLPKDDEDIFTAEDEEAIRKAVTTSSGVSAPDYSISGYPSYYPDSPYGESNYPEFDS